MRTLHAIPIRVVVAALGAFLIFDSILRHFALAFVMVVAGAVLLLSAIVDVCPLEVTIKALGGDVDSRPVGPRERHA